MNYKPRVFYVLFPSAASMAMPAVAKHPYIDTLSVKGVVAIPRLELQVVTLDDADGLAVYRRHAFTGRALQQLEVQGLLQGLHAVELAGHFKNYGAKVDYMVQSGWVVRGRARPYYVFAPPTGRPRVYTTLHDALNRSPEARGMFKNATGPTEVPIHITDGHLDLNKPPNGIVSRKYGWPKLTKEPF